MQKKTTLPSGHELVINHVSLEAASSLLQLVATELTGIDKRLSDTILVAILSGDKENLKASLAATDINTFLNIMLRLLGSRQVLEAVIACMEKWVLAGEKVTWARFDPDDFRQDLLPCAKEVGRHALLPFFESLALLSPIPTDPPSASRG